MPNVAYIRDELRFVTASYEQLMDCMIGQKAIKGRTTTYLPRPNGADTSAENSARYNAYLERALFYNVTARTRAGLIGQVFARETTMEIPDNMDVIMADAEGDGISVEQQSKRALEHVLTYGRAGLLADYPETAGKATSKAQLATGEIRPIVKLYPPLRIINWRTKTVGSKVYLSLVVLEEMEDVADDGFETTVVKAFRVLRLTDENVYTVQIYREQSGADGNGSTARPSPVYLAEDVKTPVDAGGKPFKEIPFTFIGAENNDHVVDGPPLLDMSNINIGHYRNSADYEESCFIAGQPTPWASGITKEWAKEVLKGKIELGSRAFLALPKDGQAGLLQAEANIMPFEAMEHKERQMVALGAKLVEQQEVQRTATEARQAESAETSVLASAVKNVSSAYVFILQRAHMFLVAAKEPIELEYVLNSDFDLAKMTPEERNQLMAEWQGEGISFTEYRFNLKRGGVAYQDDEEMKDEIDTNPPITTAEETGLDQSQQVIDQTIADADEFAKEKATTNA